MAYGRSIHGRGQVPAEEVQPRECDIKDVLIEDLWNQVVELTICQEARESVEPAISDHGTDTTFVIPYHKDAHYKAYQGRETYLGDLIFRDDLPKVASSLQAEEFIDWLNDVDDADDTKAIGAPVFDEYDNDYVLYGYVEHIFPTTCIDAGEVCKMIIDRSCENMVSEATVQKVHERNIVHDGQRNTNSLCFKGKFGLTTTQILRVVTKLEAARVIDCLQLLHFHIGSQVSTTELLTGGVAEAAQIYCELGRLGADMRVIDMGGGLGIDYDGSKSMNSNLSVAYTLEEYAAAIVRAVRIVCDRKGVKHPVICSECTRAIVSHHSILVFKAVSVSSPKAESGISSIGL
ncbi:hypothetical protein Droror1_Dr00021302 [Drosera rotundifolia]